MFQPLYKSSNQYEAAATSKLWLGCTGHVAGCRHSCQAGHTCPAHLQPAPRLAAPTTPARLPPTVHRTRRWASCCSWTMEPRCRRTCSCATQTPRPPAGVRQAAAARRTSSLHGELCSHSHPVGLEYACGPKGQASALQCLHAPPVWPGGSTQAPVGWYRPRVCRCLQILYPLVVHNRCFCCCSCPLPPTTQIASAGASSPVHTAARAARVLPYAQSRCGPAAAVNACCRAPLGQSQQEPCKTCCHFSGLPAVEWASPLTASPPLRPMQRFGRVGPRQAKRAATEQPADTGAAADSTAPVGPSGRKQPARKVQLRVCCSALHCMQRGCCAPRQRR